LPNNDGRKYVRKNFTLPVEVATALEEEAENQSQYVSETLRERLNVDKRKRELEKQLEDLERKRAAIKAELNRVEKQKEQKTIDLIERARFFWRKENNGGWEKLNVTRDEWLREAAEDLDMDIDTLQEEFKDLKEEVENGET